MYSWEMNEMIGRKSGILSPQEYLDITNIKTNPQISRVKYDPYTDSFFIATKDGFSWTIKLKIE